jgi:hypothetical protein
LAQDLGEMPLLLGYFALLNRKLPSETGPAKRV